MAPDQDGAGIVVPLHSFVEHGAETSRGADTALTGPRRLHHTRRRPLGSLVLGLLAIALSRRAQVTPDAARLRWISQLMGIPTADIEDGDSLYRVLDTPVQPGE